MARRKEMGEYHGDMTPEGAWKRMLGFDAEVEPLFSEEHRRLIEELARTYQERLKEGERQGKPS